MRSQLPIRRTSRNLFGFSKKERTAKRKKFSAASTDARGAGFRYGTGKSDENFSEWLDRKDLGDEKQTVKERLGVAFSSGYERGRAQVAGKEKIERKREEYAEKKLQKDIEALDRKVEAAEKKIDKAQKSVERGALTEAGFEAMRARLQKEIDRYEAHKRTRAAANPSWGYGVYQPGLFGQGEQLAHFKSKAAAETYARSHGLQGYSIKPAFAKNPGCARTVKAKVSDRAKRYRANQPGCRPAGVKKCKLCGVKSDVMVDHIDGDESNGRKSNLRWLCRSCNTLLGAEMARSGQGRRTVQYNPGSGGAKSLGEYINAVLQHTRGAHDEAGKIIHETPKWKRQEYASEIWNARKMRGNPARNSAIEFSTEYHLGYNLGQADRQSANLRKTPGELHASFAANFETVPSASWESFEQAYQAGYGGQMGAAAPASANPSLTFHSKAEADRAAKKLRAAGFTGELQKSSRSDLHNQWYLFTDADWESLDRLIPKANPAALRNPETESSEYDQAKKIAELFHGRPVKEEITVTESIKEHDWLWRIGPLVKLKIRTLTKRNATLPFHQSEEAMVHLFCSPDGRQFYLRGGDQELDVKALGMGPDTEWYRDHMLIGEAKEITYRDKKRFHSFKIVEYFHKLGEVTKKKPMLAYDALAHKMQIIGGQYKVETEDLVDGMSPGIVN